MRILKLIPFGSPGAACAPIPGTGNCGACPRTSVSSRTFRSAFGSCLSAVRYASSVDAGHRDHAIEQIDKAINDIKVAAMDDGKNPWHTPPPQSGGSEGWPIHSAVKLLKEARHDVITGTIGRMNHGLRERSVEHIDHALRTRCESAM
jgi:hypothetical protein